MEVNRSIGALWKDLRYGFRMLKRKPFFTAMAISTLALGIGANTAIFSVVNGVLLTPLPYEDPQRLMLLWMRLDLQGISRAPVSGPELVDFRQQSELFEHFGGIWARFGTLGGPGDPELIDIGWVTGDFFNVLGVRPFLGRTFRPIDVLPGGPDVILLSHGLWQRRYGGDPQIVGRAIDFNGEPYTVVGIMPQGFQVLMPPDAGVPTTFEAWLPWAAEYASMRRNWHLFRTIGRLQPGVTAAQAQAEMEIIANRLREQHADYDQSGLAIDVVPLHQDLVAHVRTALLAVFGAVAFVVLIACANVANLLLIRMMGRERELALRSALGANRVRVAIQILIENLLLFLLGGVAGLLVALGMCKLLVALEPIRLPRLSAIEIDIGVLAFSFLTVLLTGLAFGAIPAFQATRRDLTAALKEGGRTTAGGARQRLRSALVVAEVALSLILMIGAGLMLRSFHALQQVERGFDATSVLTLKISLPFTQYSYREPETISTFYDQLVGRVAALPGVEHVGTTDHLPLGGVVGDSEPYAYDTSDGEVEWESVTAYYSSVTSDYFRAVGTRLLAGRYFNMNDDLTHPAVAIVDDKLARRAWPGQEPIGKRLKVNVFLNGQTQAMDSEVVGVVEHVRSFSLETEGGEQIYLPHQQSPRRSMTLAVRSAVDPDNLTESIRREVLALDPGRPIYDVQPMERYVTIAMARIRFVLLLLGVFAALAGILAAVGIYGVIAHTVRQATQEIGVRIALGARRVHILLQVIGDGMRLVALGVAAGLVAALALSSMMSSLIFGVDVRDLSTFVAVPMLTFLVALLACYLPARRATRVDPAVALRSE